MTVLFGPLHRESLVCHLCLIQIHLPEKSPESSNSLKRCQVLQELNIFEIQNHFRYILKCFHFLKCALYVYTCEVLVIALYCYVDDLLWIILISKLSLAFTTWSMNSEKCDMKYRQRSATLPLENVAYEGK